MTKSNGIKSLKQAAKLLNKHAPDGESLAYINPEEANILKARGSSGILTVAGVPSYFLDKIWKGIKDVGSSFLGRYTGDKGGSNIVKDVASVWVGLQAKKDREGLNEHEQNIYNDLKSQMAAAETEFAINVAGGPSVTNVPTTIEDVASYTDVTLPTMKTTAVAEGGRIGYTEAGDVDPEYNGWKKIYETNPSLAEMHDNHPQYLKRYKSEGHAQGGRIGYNLGGIGAMDPRIGYQMGSPHGQVIPTFSEGVQQMYESGPAGVDTETINYTEAAYPVIREKMKSYAGMIGSDNIYDIIEVATQVGDKEFVDYLRQTFTLEGDRGIENPGMEWKESKQWGALGAAHGGRIGAKEGGIMPLLNLGGMEKDYRQDGGFVPIGRREKADDVPARLSKNEFVFTADAVRAAGGGDIDEGAQRMYNVMKNLEAGGEISEQSQGKA